MAGGGLIILPHKTWNPYGKEQRERVKKDEKEHKEKEEKREKRARDVEQERRYEKLRSKNKRGKADKHSTGDDSTVVSIARVAPPTSFSILDGNHEHMLEKKREKEKHERQFTTYLGQSSIELAKEKPWYYHTGSTHPTQTQKTQEPAPRVVKDLRLRQRSDPLIAMNRMVSEARGDSGLSSRGGASNAHGVSRLPIGVEDRPAVVNHGRESAADKHQLSMSRHGRRSHRHKTSHSNERRSKRDRRKRRHRDSSLTASDDTDRDGGGGHKSARLARLRKEREERERLEQQRLRTLHPELAPPPAFTEIYAQEQQRAQEAKRAYSERKRYNSSYSHFHSAAPSRG